MPIPVIRISRKHNWQFNFGEVIQNEVYPTPNDGEYELHPVGTADEIKAKDERIAVLERALELLWEDAGTIKGIDEKDSIDAYIAQATRELADEAKEKKR